MVGPGGFNRGGFCPFRRHSQNHVTSYTTEAVTGASVVHGPSTSRPPPPPPSGCPRLLPLYAVVGLPRRTSDPVTVPSAVACVSHGHYDDHQKHLTLCRDGGVHQGRATRTSRPSTSLRLVERITPAHRPTFDVGDSTLRVRQPGSSEERTE